MYLSISRFLASLPLVERKKRSASDDPKRPWVYRGVTIKPPPAAAAPDQDEIPF